ncbi:MAG: host specificity factor TipJ family phage tail protein [Thermodesulfobacteriota bacterium]
MMPDLALSITPHPLSTRTDLRIVPAGGSIADLLRAAGYDWVLFPQVHALVTIETDFTVTPVPRDQWETTFPAAGDRLGVRVVPGFGSGSKDATRIVLQLAILAAAIAAQQYWAASAILTIGGKAVLTWGNVAAAGIMIGGSMLVNAIAPPQAPRLSTPSAYGGISGIEAAGTVYSITGARNKASYYGAIPQVLGTFRLYPPYGAEPYTEICGDDEYLRMLFICYGPIQINDIRIGDTPLTAFSDYEVETREGWDTDEPITLYTKDVHQEALNLSLTAAAGWLERRSPAGIDEINFDLACPQGLYQIDVNSASKLSTTVSFQAEYRAVGASSWSPFPASYQTLVVDGFTGSPATGQTVTGGTSGATGTCIGLTLATMTGTQVSGDWIQVGEEVIGGTSGAHGLVQTRGVLYASPLTVITTFGAFQVGETFTGVSTGGQGTVSSVSTGSVTIHAPTKPFVTETITFSGGGTITASSPGNVQISASAKALGLYRQNYRTVVARGQYDVRWRRLTADDTTGYVINSTVITALRTVTCQDPVSSTLLPPMAKIALRIKATGQLNGVIDELNFLAESSLRVWGGAAWNQVLSSSPAWAYVHALTGPANLKPLDDDRLDLDMFMEWADFCEENGLEINAVVDNVGTLFKLLTDIASVGRASFSMRDNLYSVAYDGPKTVAVQTFTPRNSWGFTGTKAFPDLPHALRVRFTDKDNNYKQNERYVYADGYSESNASRFETLDLWGVTDSDQAWKAGRFHMADAMLRPETFVLSADVEYLRCTRGDLVNLAHDVILVGLAYGRIKSVTVDGGGNVLTATLDETVTMEAGKSYGLGIRLDTGTTTCYSVVTAAGSTKTVEFTYPIPASAAPAGGELVFFGESGSESEECIVTKIEPGPDITAQLTLRHYAPAVFEADQGEIPAFDPLITWPSPSQRVPGTPVIEAVTSDESVLLRAGDGSLTPRILVSYSIPSGILPTEVVQGQFRESPDGTWRSLPGQPVDGRQFYFESVEEGVAYDLRLRSISHEGATSAWVTVTAHTVIGKTTPPPDVEGLLLEGSRIVWQYDDPGDLAGFRIKFNVGNNRSWDSAASVSDGLVSDTFFDVSNLFGTVTILVKAVDSGGRESSNAAILVKDLGDPITENIVLTTSYAPDWPGTITGGSIVSGVIEADSTSQMWKPPVTGVPPLPMWSFDSALMWPGQYDALSYEAEYVHPVNLAGESLVLDYAIQGEGFILEYKTDSPSPIWSGVDAEPMWSADDSAPMWSPMSDYRPWPGRLDDAPAQTYFFRLALAAGATQGQISQFDVLVDVEDIEEDCNDVAISATGTRLPITLSYREIKQVLMTLQYDGGSARSLEVFDKDPDLGPMIKARDGSGTLTTALVDAQVKGY